MIILVINSGSSSVKYALFNVERELTRGLIEKIGEKGSKIKTHQQAIEKLLKDITGKHIKDLKEIKAVGHRVVHGGDIRRSVRIDDKVLKKLESLIPLAPLHNPHNLTGIKACMQLLPKAKQFAAFDTSFHTSIPKSAHTYAIPKKLTDKYNIKRYGFHGISYKFITEEVSTILSNKNLKIICCHLGNGSSIAAIRNQKSIETSMGFTPLEGLIMGTRSGDIDPGIISFLSKKEKKTTEQIINILNFESGLKGLSQKSNDMRDIIKNNDKLILETYCHRLTKYVGAYTAILNGVDIIVFTAGIGENAYKVRELVLKNLSFLDLKIDRKTNKQNSFFIPTSDSKVKAMVLKTNEELMIARDVIRLS